MTLLVKSTNANIIQACPGDPCNEWHSGKAVYLQSNEHDNSVVSIPIGRDGKLSGGIVISSGGKGGASIDGTTKKPAGPDALSSQGSVTVSGDYLFAVNAGSNTLSMFKIDQNDATHLTMIGQPAEVPGEFPVTVGASVKHNMACVGYTGAKSGTSCAQFTRMGLGQMKQVVEIDLGQTTPPMGPTNTVAQVFFAADESRLITTVKGDPSTNKTGFISVLPFKDARSPAFEDGDTRSSPPGTAVLFGGVNVPDTSDLFITDASFGTTLLSLNYTTENLFLENKVTIQGQKATCWVAYSQARKSFFVTDAAVNRLIEINKDGSEIMSRLELTNGDPGLTDLQVAGRFVYALSPGNGTMPAAITVVDSFKGLQIQHFLLEKLGAGKRSQGMAILQ
ncbi:uncharacterized protein N7484_010406 [Penicillium longicatenatum]|uniref:uncharacterized protein n=1 Tax=Penicillium longicatenatum TaxID=1561947 RepID=UPI002548B927|nr:uncharacterized protein N7484_010406 [Penicillium longicatenatum]KAJ5630306.1 hypothetical protein N7484_010406 [Penicillium longicatenatum]